MLRDLITLKVNKSLLVLTVALCASGCVQKATYNNTGKPAAVAQKVDNIDAAKTRIALGLQYLKGCEITFELSTAVINRSFDRNILRINSI